MPSLHPEIFLGLMSGTSMDGVDALAASFDAAGAPSYVGSHHIDYPETLGRELNRLCVSGSDEIDRCGRAGRQLGRLYGQAITELLEQLALPACKIIAAGVHGQTIRHRPQEGWSLQLNAPAVIAEISHVNIIADFRARDLAAGGEGAPLVPAFHRNVFSGKVPRAIVNIGGIANVSLLREKACHAAPLGFDCGPGNTLLDAWCRRYTSQPFDKNGQWSRTGHCNAHLLKRLLDDPYFSRPAPKSTGREYFHLQWLQSYLQGESPQDVQATLTALTACCIAQAITRYAPDTLEVFVCGGGAFNSAILANLQQFLPRAHIGTTAELGIPPMQVECLAFAWLAWAFWHRIPGNIPAATHAAGPRILGALYPA